VQQQQQQWWQQQQQQQQQQGSAEKQLQHCINPMPVAGTTLASAFPDSQLDAILSMNPAAASAA
jgi:hypothetical protein